MPSKKRLVVVATVSLVSIVGSAGASYLPGTDQRPHRFTHAHTSTGAGPAGDTRRLVKGYLEYIEGLQERSDLSFERMQSSVGISLQRTSLASGEITSTYPDGDWATLSFWNEGDPKFRSASLELVNDRRPNLMSPQCRLSLETVRERLLRAGYDEMQEWHKLEGAGAWLYFKGDIWIQVGASWISTSPLDRQCVSTIDAHDRVQLGDESI